MMFATATTSANYTCLRKCAVIKACVTETNFHILYISAEFDIF